LDLLVQAFADVSHHTNARLLVIGPDFAGGRQFLEQRAKKLGCEKQTHFVGPQVGAPKWALLEMADACVSPSRWEAFGISQAEALGMGLPTIISDKFNMAPEWAAGRIALISPLSSEALAYAMRQVMTDASLRDSLSKAGRQWVAEMCSPGPAGARFAEFYEEVLADSSSPRVAAL
jgi:glycosyltransferase involved in cell wall biosynthesis